MTDRSDSRNGSGMESINASSSRRRNLERGEKGFGLGIIGVVGVVDCRRCDVKDLTGAGVNIWIR
jgi:hypothetical protein